MNVAEYKNPDQLQAGDVLVVGGGNSGAEIAIEAVDPQGIPGGSKHWRDPVPIRKRCRPRPDADHRPDRLSPGANDQVSDR